MTRSTKVVCGAAAALGVFYLSAQDRNDINPMARNPDAAASGRRLYDQTCQACHGGEARGDRGPALTGAFSHGSEDGDLFRNIHDGITGSGMPAFASLTADQVWQLVSYLRSLNGTTAAAPNELASGDPAAGEATFFGKAACGACHQVNGRGGIVGPDLSVPKECDRIAAPEDRRPECRHSPRTGGRGGQDQRWS
jgi:mono/diheme cytochrome c family protein